MHRLPDVHERIDAGAIERLAPGRPRETAIAPFSGDCQPPSLCLPSTGKTTQPLVDAVAPHGKNGKAEECERFNHGVNENRGCIGLRTQPGLIESQSVVLDAPRPPLERVSDAFYRWLDLRVDLHQSMVQPLDGPRAGRIQRSVSYFAVIVDAEIRHGRRQRPRMPMSARGTRAFGERVDRNLARQPPGAIPVFGNRQVLQQLRIRPGLDDGFDRLDVLGGKHCPRSIRRPVQSDTGIEHRCAYRRQPSVEPVRRQAGAVIRGISVPPRGASRRRRKRRDRRGPRSPRARQDPTARTGR